MQKYTHDLVINESNLDTMFESAQRQIEEEQERIEAAAALGESDGDDEAKLFNYDVKEFSEEDYNEMADFLEQEKEKDFEVM